MNDSAADKSCRPYELAANSTLPDRTPCVQGFCMKVTNYNLCFVLIALVAHSVEHRNCDSGSWVRVSAG